MLGESSLALGDSAPSADSSEFGSDRDTFRASVDHTKRSTSDADVQLSGAAFAHLQVRHSRQTIERSSLLDRQKERESTRL